MKRVKTLSLIIAVFCFFISLVEFSFSSVFAMPFYDFQPKEIVLRAEFYTSYPSSTDERKTNIMLAAKSLDNILIAPNEEFSFNKTVGERTEKRGYKSAKIIVNGEFVDGVGGGVCQVSTTLYNAVLLAGLKIIEYHPHSLPVSYVAPSFDAMVNSGWADLRFINNTHNPVILRTFADGSILKVQVYGEPMQEKIIRKSIITGEIPAPEYEILTDTLREFSDLYEGDIKIITYSKAGYKSEGYLIKTVSGKVISSTKIRSDSYSAVRGKIIKGTIPRVKEPLIDSTIITVYRIKPKI
ncbi:MAG: hypothetical protein E7340_04040 [Clostridiales bacterium]|nr:hypothetical protein [Clostridiales bacterium]